MILRDIVILGVAAPEDSKTYGKSVCVAGWQPDLGLIRIYPAMPTNGFGRWKTYDLDLEKPTADSREESWRIANPSPARIPVKRKLDGTDRKRELLERLLVDCVSDVNDARGSLCVVKPSTIVKTGWRKNTEPLPSTDDMFGRPDDWCSKRNDFTHSPMIKFNCSPACRAKTSHEQTVIEWGAFECMRKAPDNPASYWENARVNQPGYDTYLLLGNQNHRRQSFIVINVIPLKSAVVAHCDSRTQLQIAF